MAKRVLVKVAKELNVGTTTIVDYLKTKSFNIENSPTAQVTDQMYETLKKRFQKSSSIRKEADGIKIGARNQKVKTAKKTPKVNTPVPPKSEVTKKETPKKEGAKETPTGDHKKVVKGPKVVGKINLDQPKGKTKNTSTSNRRGNQKPKSTPKQEQPKVQVEKTAKVEPNKVEPKKVEPVNKEVVGKPKATEETVKVEAPQLKGLKILGKINIEPKKPKRNTNKKNTNNNRKNDGGNKTEGDAKTGEGGNKRRRRRRRTNEQPSSNNNNNNNSNNNNNNNNNSSNRQGNQSGNTGGNKEKTNSGNQSGNNTNAGNKRGARKNVTRTNDNNRGNVRNRRRGAKPKVEKQEVKEVSQKEIQEKIKQTMARLSGGGKKRRKHGTSRSDRDTKKELQRQNEVVEEKKSLQLTEFISVAELASLMDVSPPAVITACMNLGIFVSINQRLDSEVIELVAAEFEYEVEFISAEEQLDNDDEEIVDKAEDLENRAPIVTVMGHVDHGKTSLLDFIRKANVADGEAGGITQHIGAYEVTVGDTGKVTFLDTPGHEAFTAMRARGAKVTDVAVIIISADDNVMPQTKEAISHAQAAGVPIVFAINKIDKDGANPERIKQELASMNFLVEDWGGKYQSQEISAKKGLNIDSLLEKILLEAEMLELQANPDRQAVGVVLEASLDKGRGYVTKTLVQTGTLKVGDSMVAGGFSGKVKAMFNERGQRVEFAGPSTPVLVLGLNGAPQAGEKIKVMESEQEARQLANKRAQINRQQQIRASRRITLDDISHRLQLGSFKELNLIVKGDMDGSVEALSDSLLKLSTETVQTKIVHKAVGGITESDVLLASASDAIIIGFQVRPNPTARRLAEQEGVQLKMYSVIYDAIDEVKLALEGLLEPTKVEEEVCSIEVRNVFKISKIGTIAGCFVNSGKVTRNTFIRIIRDNMVIFPKKEGAKGELASLRRFKDDVREVRGGFECGLTIKGFNDLKEGDIIEGYEIKEVKQKL